MARDLNPQAEQMAHESMVRNLAAQADAIWPQEVPLFARYGLARREAPRILDAGCGTGEITSRLAALLPHAALLGVDVHGPHLELARERALSTGVAARVRFEERSIFELGLPSGSFDLVVCRHVLQSLPHPERAIAELARVARPGGWLHLLVEDYGMIQFEPRTLDADRLWAEGPKAYGRAIGTDLQIGRNAFRIVAGLGLVNPAIDYLVVDPLRVPRATFAAIWEAWRDGFAGAVAEHTRLGEAEFRAHFDDMLATLADPAGYGVWFVPIVAAQVPLGAA
jgi:SAM-dependent methyltransferase